MEGQLILHFIIEENNLTTAGEASSKVKKRLSQLGILPDIIKKVVVPMYEAELNAVIHANGGFADVEINKEKIVIILTDKGPGIPDIELAMKEGFSTAPDHIKNMGFGAGMGLPNMKKYADELNIVTEVGVGTSVKLTVYLTKD